MSSPPTPARRSRVAAAAALAWVAIVAAAAYRIVPSLLLSGRWRELIDGGFSGDPRLPYATEAMFHAAHAVAGAAALVLSAGVLGSGILAVLRCRADGAAERWPVAVALGAGGFGILGLLFTALGIYRPPVLVLAAAVPLVATLVRRMRASSRARATDARPVLARRVLVPRGDRAWAACAALAAGLSLVAALAPDWQYDAIWFHLYFPRLFLERGTLVQMPTEYVSLYPMTWGLWFGYGLALGGQPVATLLHYACLPLTALLVHAAARRIAPGASPWLAAALFVAVPVVQWEAATAYIDLAVALELTVAVYALLRHADGERGWLIVAALALGVALASKHLVLVPLAILVPGTAALLLARGRHVAAVLRSATVLGAVAVAVALPWYARSWLVAGNPFFPELHAVFGASPEWWDERSADALAAFMSRFGRERTLASLAALPWDVTVHAARYGGALGPLFLALVPLLALPARGARASAAGGSLRWVAAFVVLYVAVWASPLASYQVRWLVPVTPLLALLAAAGFARARELVEAAAGAGAGRALAAAAVAMLVLNTPPFTRAQEGDRAPGRWTGWLDHTLHGVPLGVVLGGESRDAYLRRRVPTADAWRYANATLPRDATVLAYSGGDHFFAERRRLSALATSLRVLAWAPPADSTRALDALRARGVTHVLVDRPFLRDNGFPPAASWDHYAVPRAAGRGAGLSSVYDDGRVALYALRRPPELPDEMRPPAQSAPARPSPRADAVRHRARTGQRGQLRERAVQTRAPSSIRAWL